MNESELLIRFGRTQVTVGVVRAITRLEYKVLLAYFAVAACVTLIVSPPAAPVSVTVPVEVTVAIGPKPEKTHSALLFDVGGVSVNAEDEVFLVPVAHARNQPPLGSRAAK